MSAFGPDGIIGGVQAGYNWQVNNYLLGLEADANWPHRGH
jgi:outer membrane immunogenic protein